MKSFLCSSSSRSLTCTPGRQLLLAVGFLVLSWFGGVRSGGTEEGDFMLGAAAKLESYLLSNYSTIARPVRYGHESVSVDFDFILNQVLEVNEQEQKITTAVWNVRQWNDAFLSWDPINFGNISDIRIDKNRIWFPDLVVTNTIAVQEADIKIKVDHRGDVMWDSALVLETSCHINVKYFPYDHQFCKVEIGSWTFTQRELDLLNSSDSGIVDYYVENDAWEMLGVSVKRSFNEYPGYTDPLVDLCYTIHLKRRPRFFELNVILPCALLSVVVIAVFCLPCECGEKITLSITILLALAVNNVMISEKMPPSSKNSPILGDYFLSQVSLVMASVFASVLVLTIHHKGTQRKPVPPMIKYIAFEGLAKFLFMQNSITTLQRTTFSSRSPSHGGIVLVTNGSAVKGGGPRNLSPRSTCHNSLKISSDDQIRCNRSTVMNNSCSNLDFGSKNESSADTQNSPDHDKACEEINDNLQTIQGSLRQIKEFVQQHEMDLEVDTEWKELAMVVDRLFSIIFFVISSMISLFFMILMPLGAERQLQKILKEEQLI